MALILAAGVGILRAHAQQATFQLPAINPPGAANKPAHPAGSDASRSGPNGLETASDGKPSAQRECSNLLKMATELKVEVDKTTKDTLSVTVVRKADEIEQYARKLRNGDGKS